MLLFHGRRDGGGIRKHAVKIRRVVGGGRRTNVMMKISNFLKGDVVVERDINSRGSRGNEVIVTSSPDFLWQTVEKISFVAF